MTSPTSSRVAAKRLTLSVSFSGPGGSLALRSSGSVDAEWTESIDWEKKATASELATIKLGELLARRRLDLADLTHILVNHGPGSFTGIRVGLNLARTLAYALDLPIAAVDTLSVLAQKYLRAGETGVVALKAVQSYYYAAGFARGTGELVTTLAPTSLDRAQLDQVPATKVLIEDESPDFDPRVAATDVLDHQRDLPDVIRFFSWARVNPLYIRGSEAEEKLKKGLLKPL